MPPQTATPEQYQYVKLPDGSFGKFRAGATDNEIRAKITAAFPQAYKAAPAAPSAAPTTGQKPWQKSMESGIERTALAAGVPKSPWDIPDLLLGMMAPGGDPKNPTLGEHLPVLGPALTASQQVMNQPAKSIPEKLTRAAGSVPFVGPPFYAGTKALQSGDFATAIGSLINIATQFLGMKAPVESALEDKLPSTVRYSPDAAVKPGVTVSGAPTGTIGMKLASRFGIRPDYADQIGAKVDEIRKARATMESERAAAQKSAQAGAAGVRKSAAGDIARSRESTASSVGIMSQMRDKVVSDLEKEMGSAQSERRSTGQQLIADTAKAAHEELQRVRAPFEEIGAKIGGGVAQGSEIRDIIGKAVAAHGVKPDELPPAAFKALPVGKASAVRVGGIAADPSTLPESIRNLMTPEERGESPVTFNDLTRVREDLYHSAAMTKDSAMRVGLKDAATAITDLQESIAAKHGLGPQYGAAKRDYMMFRRGIGSSAVEKWLSAEDAKAQAIEPKLARLSNKANQEALSTVMRSVGVNPDAYFGLTDKILRTAKSIKDVEADSRALTAAEKARGGAIESAAEQQVSAIEQASKERIAASDKAGTRTIKAAQKLGESVVPGKTTEDLAGRSNLDLNRMRLRAMGNSIKGKGIANPYSLFQIVYGLARMATSPVYGAFHLAYGAGREALPEIVKDAKFQEWVLRKSGVAPSSPVARQIRQGLIDVVNKSTPASRRAVLNSEAPNGTQ